MDNIKTKSFKYAFITSLIIACALLIYSIVVSVIFINLNKNTEGEGNPSSKVEILTKQQFLDQVYSSTGGG